MQGHSRINVKDVSLVEPKGAVCSSSYFMAYPCQTYNSSIFGKRLNLCKCFISIFFCLFFFLKQVYFSAWVNNRKYACGLISEVRKVRKLCNGSERVFVGGGTIPLLRPTLPVPNFRLQGCSTIRKTMETPGIILFFLITQKCPSHGMRTLTYVCCLKIITSQAPLLIWLLDTKPGAGLQSLTDFHSYALSFS